jgi:hypothetical protein
MYDEKELDDIRVALYEQMKNMSKKEKLEFLNGKSREAAKVYGFTIVKDASELIAPKK